MRGRRGEEVLGPTEVRRKAGEGIKDFLGRSEAGKSTGGRYQGCEQVDFNGEAPGGGQEAVRGSRGEGAEGHRCRTVGVT